MKLRYLFTLLLAFGSLSAAAEEINVEEFFVELGDHEIFAVRTLADLSVDSTMRRHSAGVTYTDGSNKSYNFTYNFPAGYDSPWMDLDRLRTPGKCVKSVFVNAQSRDANVRSRVKVLGNTN